jgi:diadenosine tetraphosphate (Ap4A) HIT family hydrolase
MSDTDCRFCRKSERPALIAGKLALVRYDRHPVSEGHALIIPHRHFPDYFDATDDEKAELWQLVDAAKKMIDETYSPDGYNIGINIGKHAGQSIPHLHIHLMPRYQGDVENPKGGVRGVIPAKQKYTLVE